MRGYSWGMSDADPAARGGSGAVLAPGVLLVLAGVFSAVTVGCLVLVAVDLMVGRPVSGDLYVAGLNGVLAAIFWVWRVRARRRGPGSAVR
jgi:hypothetical protein